MRVADYTAGWDFHPTLKIRRKFRHSYGIVKGEYGFFSYIHAVFRPPYAIMDTPEGALYHFDCNRSCFSKP